MAVGLKVTSCTLFSLRVESVNPHALSSVLESQVTKNEHFFKYGNVVLDFVTNATVDEIKALVSEVERFGLTVIGITGSVDRLQSYVCKLPILNNKSGAGLLLKDYESMQHDSSSEVVKRDILSGENFVSKGRDLVIVGDVFHGARVASKGDVIVLGKVHGRVYAGSDGDASRTIVGLEMFAQELGIAGVSALGYQIGFRDDRSRVCLIDGKLIYDN